MLEGFFRHEQVGDAEFVFQRDETMALGGGRALAADDQAGNADGSAVTHGARSARVLEGRVVRSFPPEFHRVRAGAGALGAQVGLQALAGGHRGERDGRVWESGPPALVAANKSS
jgi:hypothetical protein